MDSTRSHQRMLLVFFEKRRRRRTLGLSRAWQRERSGRWKASAAADCSARSPRPVRLTPVCPARLLKHLICQQEQGWGHRYPKLLGGLEVEDELEIHRLLNGEVRGVGPFQDL